MADVTRILEEIENGDPRAAADLLPLVYTELKVWLRASLPGRGMGRRHFFAAAAESMRRILVENAAASWP